MSGRVTISLTIEEAERLTFSLSDLLCWHRGYAAGCGPEDEHDPMGVDAARRLNIMLKDALCASEKEIVR